MTHSFFILTIPLPDLDPHRSLCLVIAWFLPGYIGSPIFKSSKKTTIFDENVSFICRFHIFFVPLRTLLHNVPARTRVRAACV